MSIIIVWDEFIQVETSLEEVKSSCDQWKLEMIFELKSRVQFWSSRRSGIYIFLKRTKSVPRWTIKCKHEKLQVFISLQTQIWVTDSFFRLYRSVRTEEVRRRCFSSRKQMSNLTELRSLLRLVKVIMTQPAKKEGSVMYMVIEMDGKLDWSIDPRS